MTQRIANIIFCVLIIVGSGFMIKIAFDFEGKNQFSSPEQSAALFPIFILSCIILFCLIHIVKCHKEKLTEAGKALVELDRAQLIRVVLAFVVSMISYFIWLNVGFVVMAVFLMAAMILIMRVRSIKIIIFLLLFGPALYLVLTQAMRITLK